MSAIMSLVLQSLVQAFRQLGDPAILKVLAKTVLITLALFAVLGWGIYAALTELLERAGLFSGFNSTFVLTALLTMVALWLLFRIAAVAVLQFFADEVVAAVEARHYPDACGTALSFKQDLANSARGIGRTLLFNLLAVPIAILLVFTAIGPGIVFLIVNAVLLGRELTDMCWLRLKDERIENGSAVESPVTRTERTLLGASVAGLMLIPLANFIAPIIGAAAGTHLVHAKQAQRQKDD